MSFEHTFRGLGRMKLRAHAGLLLLLVATLAAWVVWLARGSVAIYVRSQRARLEVEQNAFPIQSEVGGVVTRCELQLGRHVAAGDTLIQLDTRLFELQLAEKRAVMEGRRLALSALAAQLDAESRARDSVAGLVSDTRRVARDRISVDERTAEYKDTERAMIDKLRAESLASGLEALRAQSEQEATRKQLALTRHQGSLDTKSALTSLRDREAAITNLNRTVVDQQSELALLEAQVASLQFEVDRRAVRALVSGTLSDVIGCAPGMTLDTTHRLATLEPDGKIRAVAYFAPHEAIGRVKRGAPTIIRVENYPWTQFGVLRGTVSQVGSEARDGQIRVEFELASNQEHSIPIAHGLVVTTEVRTEELSPGKLLLRLAGQAWQSPQASSPPTEARSTP